MLFRFLLFGLFIETQNTLVDKKIWVTFDYVLKNQWTTRVEVKFKKLVAKFIDTSFCLNTKNCSQNNQDRISILQVLEDKRSKSLEVLFSVQKCNESTIHLKKQSCKVIISELIRNNKEEISLELFRLTSQTKEGVTIPSWRISHVNGKLVRKGMYNDLIIIPCASALVVFTAMVILYAEHHR